MNLGNIEWHPYPPKTTTMTTKQDDTTVDHNVKKVNAATPLMKLKHTGMEYPKDLFSNDHGMATGPAAR